MNQNVDNQIGGYVPPAVGHPEADQAEFMRGYEMGMAATWKEVARDGTAQVFALQERAQKLEEAVRVLRRACVSAEIVVFNRHDATTEELRQALESTKEYA